MDCPKRRCHTEAAVVLPDDPLLEILSRVPAKSLCRFKCVSKAWRDFIADPLHRKKLAQTLQGFFFMVQGHHCHGESDCQESCLCKDGKKVPCYFGFIDVLQRSVRPVDFSYLTEPPGIKNTRLIHCCNGLLLFAVECNLGTSWSYVVCNPTTKQCVAVPSSGLEQTKILYRSLSTYRSTSTYLLFDPGAGAPCHFNLVQYSKEGVHVYSSKTQEWTQRDLRCYNIAPLAPSVYVNGMLHLISYPKDELTLFDVEGNIHKIIPPPCRAGREKWTASDYIGWSQGCLHYINNEMPGGDGFHGFLIWVLDDYERQQWVLRDTVSFSKLSGERNDNEDIDYNYDVVGIHPDHSLVFLVKFCDQKLISYHMDTKEVRDLCALEHVYKCIMTPYAPSFSELLALENKQ